MLRNLLISSLFVVFLAACQSLEVVRPNEAATQALVTDGVLLEPEGFIQRIHDPVIAQEGGTYYVFSTGSLVPFICSKDKISWEFCGRIFKSNPAWTREINPNLVDIWAPDI
jgi:beta-xylosidase